MPTFIDTVRYWQERSSASPLVTALVGFSQGVIMSLENIKAALDLASRVIAFNGRYATLPMIATTAITIRLIRGGEDRIIDLAWAMLIQEVSQQAGGDVILDIVDDLGRVTGDRSIQFAIEHLRYTVPKHYFDKVLSDNTPEGDDIIEMP